MGTRGCFTPGKQQGLETDHSRPSRIEVKNCGIYLHFSLGLHDVALNRLSSRGDLAPGWCLQKRNGDSGYMASSCADPVFLNLNFIWV
jgi:hypothetical protein